MTKEGFKKLCGDIFKEYGFNKYKSINYYKMEGDAAVHLELQKSNFGNAYYINTYYYKIDKSISIPLLCKSTADEYLRLIMWSDRSTLGSNKGVTSLIEYEEYDAETLEFYIRRHFDIYINPVLQKGFMYIKKNIKYFQEPKYRKYLLLTSLNTGRKCDYLKVYEKLLKAEIFIWDCLRSRFGKHYIKLKYYIKLRFADSVRKKRLIYIVLLSATYVAWRIISLNNLAPLISKSGGRMSLADLAAILLMGVFLLLIWKNTENGMWKKVLFVIGFLFIILAIFIIILAAL